MGHDQLLHYGCTIGACHCHTGRAYLYLATVADGSLVDENWLFIRRWAAAAKMKIIMAAVTAEYYQELSLPYYAL